MKKRIVSSILALTLCLTLAPNIVFAAATPTYDIKFLRGRTQTRGGITATVSVDKVYGLKEGDTVTITVSFSGTAEAPGRFSIGFDHGGLIFDGNDMKNWRINVIKGQTSFRSVVIKATMPKKPAWDMGLALSCAFTVELPSRPTRFVPNPSDERITVKTPYFPGLEITMTNPHYYVGEFDAMTSWQVKYYFNRNTAIRFSEDVKIFASPVDDGMRVKAGEFFRPSDYGSSALGIHIVAQKDGSYRLMDSTSFNFGKGERLFWLNFVDAIHYQTNIQEGYRMTDIRKWEKKSDNIAQNAFEYKKLQSAVSSMAKELADKKLIDSRVTALNNQLIYLSNEIAAGKKPADIAVVNKSLKDADALLKKIDISKLDVYPKTNSEKKTDKAGLDITQKRLDACRKNLDRAIAAIG